MKKLSTIFRKAHYSISLILLAFGGAGLLDVFYKILPSEPEPFRYFAPTICMPFLMGLGQTAVLSFGKEKMFFPPQSNDAFLNVTLGFLDMVFLSLIAAGGIYLSNIFSNSKIYVKREEIFIGYLISNLVQIAATVWTALYAEYIIFANKENQNGIPKKQFIRQGMLYALVVVLLVTNILCSFIYVNKTA